VVVAAVVDVSVMAAAVPPVAAVVIALAMSFSSAYQSNRSTSWPKASPRRYEPAA